MEWTADAIILGSRPHGESSLVLEVMTDAHGRHLGLVRGGRSRRMQPVLQLGNEVQLTWRARLESHLGQYTVDLKTPRAAQLMESAAGVYGAQIIAAHLRYLAERDPHPALYSAANVILDHLTDPMAAARLIVRFELALLDELGFGLDLTSCAATGSTQELVYVSPKSARAVSRQAGEPYRDKLLPLPGFLRLPMDVEPSPAELHQAFMLTGYFLERHVAGPRTEPLSPARAQLLERLLPSLPQATA